MIDADRLERWFSGETLHYDREHGTLQTLVDNHVRQAVEVRRAVEDRAVLLVLVEELRRRGYTVIPPEAHDGV